MNRNYLYLLICLSGFITLSACKHHKEIQKAKAEEKAIVTPSSFSLFDSVITHSYKYHTLNAKVKTEFKGNDGSELSLMITLRSVSDSAIWMSASPALGIEAVRILFTRDSIKVMDKINGRYLRESYDFLKSFTTAEINYAMIQNILTGNAAFMNAALATDSITNYYKAHCNSITLQENLVVTKLFRILDNIITDNATQDKINIKYADFQYVETEYLPFDIQIEALSKGKKATILFNYTNVSVNVPVEIKFNIPSSYTKMKY